MLLSKQDFYKLFPRATRHKDLYEELSQHMSKYLINTRIRQAYFLGQLAHECMGFRYIRELGNKAYFRRYEWRKSLGNTQAGDGYKYRGRGFIQLTGRYNYTKYGKKLGIDLVNNPGLAETVPVACLIACQYWDDIGANALSDKGSFRLITKRINGGYNGLKDRKYWTNRIARLIP